MKTNWIHFMGFFMNIPSMIIAVPQLPWWGTALGLGGFSFVTYISLRGHRKEWERFKQKAIDRLRGGTSDPFPNMTVKVTSATFVISRPDIKHILEEAKLITEASAPGFITILAEGESIERTK